MQKTIFNFSVMFILILLPHSLYAEEDYPKIHAYVEPVSSVIIGQTVILYIEIERLDDKPGTPKYPEITVEGAVVLQPEQLGTSYSKNDGGRAIVGIRQKFVVIPKRSGEITIPSLNIEWRGSENLNLHTDDISMSVTVPTGVKDLARLIVGTDVTVRQSIRPDLTAVRTGDAVERTVTIAASDTIGLTLPPLLALNIAGLALYPKTPKIIDKSDRGDYRAKRIDTIVYMVEEEGDYILPALSYDWVDVDTNTLKKISLPAIRFNATATEVSGMLSTPKVVGTFSPFEKVAELAKFTVTFLKENLSALLMMIFVVAAGFLMRQRIRKLVSARIGRLRKYFKSAERAAFSKVVRACLRNDPAEMRNTLWLWIGETQGMKEIATMSSLEENLKIDDIELIKDILIRPFSAAPSRAAFGLIDLFQLRRSLRRARKGQAKSIEKYTLNPKANGHKTKC